MIGYAVIDCETTGLNRMGNDRMAEIAVATFDSNFKLTGKFETLVNPQRDLGLTSLHGINGLMASEAPTFHEIMASLAPLLHGRIVIGHNVSFDLRFIAGEYLRHGIDIWWNDSCLDTYNLAKRLRLNVENYKLGTLCAYFGINLTEAHTAMADVMATAELFQKLVTLNNNQIPHEARPLRMPRTGIIPTNNYNKWVPRGTIHEKLKVPYDYNKFLRTLPASDFVIPAASINTYLTTTHLSLINGSYTFRERERIEELVASLSLSRNNVIDLNEEYLFLLICQNLKNNAGRWSNVCSDLMSAAVEFSGIKNNRVQELITETLQNRNLIQTGVHTLQNLFTLNSGDGLVLTGEDYENGRNYWENRIIEAGFLLKKSTTKRGSKAVICNDPYSLSKNGILARKHGIPILTEKTFNRLLLTSR